MAYVDGFIMPVPKKKVAAYIKLAKLAGKIWREHGALDYKECAADDAPVGKLTSFPRSVKMHGKSTPFDGKRMIYGGFKVAVDA